MRAADRFAPVLAANLSRQQNGRNILQPKRIARHRRTEAAPERLGNKFSIVVLMATLLLLSICGAFALADGSENPGLLPPGVDSLQEFEAMAGSGESGAIDADTNPVAAETLPHTDLDRAEAAELLEEVFGNELEAPAEFFDDLEVDAFRSDYVALVDPPAPDAAAGLLSSTLPLRTENESGDKVAVDLDLEASGGDLEPRNPLAEVTIPSDLADGISMLDAGVTINIASGDVERSASELGDSSAFYPNVREETDVVITATPTGVETYTHLRSPQAPRQESFDLDIPNGSSLSANESGGAEVIGTDGGTVLTVRAPWAIDAEGASVPTSLEVEGHSIVISVDPPADAAYPILLDPVFESYYLPNSSQAQEWTGDYNTGFGYSRGGYGGPGLNVYAMGGWTAPGNQGNFSYYVPRYWSDQQAGFPKPMSYIRSMKLWGLTFAEPDEMSIPQQNRSAYPFMQLELRDEAKNEYVWQGVRMGNEGHFNDPGYVFNMTNPNENPGVKHGGFALATFGSSNPFFRYVNVQSASVEVTDKDVPSWVFALNPSGWMNNVRKDLEFGVSDGGLGVYRYRVTAPSTKGGSESSFANESCFGTFGNPCPRNVDSTGDPKVPYYPMTMAQGENTLSFVAIDPVGNESVSKPIKVKIDHTAPAISLSGKLTEQAKVGTNLSEYALSYTAKDGDDAAAAALSPFGTAGTGQGQLERPFGVAVADDGSFYVVDRINNRVVKYDKEGKFALQFGSTGSADGQLNDPRGIALAPDGTVWVADLANDRIQAFTPTGTFLRKIKFSDPASQPYAIAIAPNGSIWVTDIGIPRVVGFKDNPFSNLGALYGKQSNPSDGGTDLASPVGVAVDKYNNVWVTDNGIDKVIQFASAGRWQFQFGTFGSGPGQLQGPMGIDIAPSGNIAVMERDTNRVEIFKPDGTFLRQFGSSGSANGQFSEAGGLSFAPDNTLLVADAGNKRVARWSHADQDPQSGTTAVDVKVDGAVVHSKGQSCADKNCSLSGSWTLDADEFAGGTHKLEVTATDAVGVSQTKTIDIESHGDHTDPTIALSGTITEQASLGATRPTYKLKAVSTDSGPAAELKSGVVSTVIKVDGVVVDSSFPGCPAGGCSITREWTLNSDSYSVGSHTVEIKATDGVGRVITKTLTINIARDGTAPEFTSLATFYTAPSGWLEQNKYLPSTIVTDTAGYGVASVQLKIDGQVIQTAVANPCPGGGCARLFGYSQTVDLATYSGGAHPAELVATDGAGNTRRRSWTMNVDPEGHISATEATDTLEAVEVTAPESHENSPVGGLVTGSVGEEGSNPQLVEDEGKLISVGTPTPSEIALDPDEGFSVGTVAPSDNGSVLTSNIEVEPTSLGANASAPQITDGSAAVVANSASGVDTVLRPAYDGLMAFHDIRDRNGPEEYSWLVRVGEDETLELLDETHAAVFWDDGTQAMLITAQSAHDADGKAVPTSLTVSGQVITLTVHHKGTGVIYPVVAGLGYEGGFQQIRGEMPGPAEQTVLNPETIAFYELQVGAPELVPASEADGEASASSVAQERRRKFVRSVCGHTSEWVESWEGGKAIAEGKVQSYCGNGFDPNNHPGKAVIWRGSMRGAFLYSPGVRVRHRGSKDCIKGVPGESKIRFYTMKDAYECHYGPLTSDGNGGVKVGAGHYLRAQAHWEVGERGKCWSNQPSEECIPPDTCWMWQDRAIELHLWPSGNIDPIKLATLPADPC